MWRVIGLYEAGLTIIISIFSACLRAREDIVINLLIPSVLSAWIAIGLAIEASITNYKRRHDYFWRTLTVSMSITAFCSGVVVMLTTFFIFPLAFAFSFVLFNLSHIGGLILSLGLTNDNSDPSVGSDDVGKHI